MKAGKILFICILLILSACSHKEILFPEGGEHTITVNFMWREDVGEKPTGMTLYFFPYGAGKIWRFDIAGSEGGSVELPLGSYSLLAYNNDIPKINVSGLTSLSEATATMRSKNNITPGSGRFFCASVARIDVTPCGVTYTSGEGEKECPYGLVRCVPEQRYCNYSVIIRNVTGLENVRQANVLIGKLAADIGIASGRPGTEGVDCTVPMQLSPAQRSMQGSCTNFGCRGADDVIMAAIDIVRNDGTVLEKIFDVSSQVHSAPNPREFTIVIDNIDIPDIGGDTPDKDPDVGIGVEVDGWNVINIDIST